MNVNFIKSSIAFVCKLILAGEWESLCPTDCEKTPGIARFEGL